MSCCEADRAKTFISILPMQARYESHALASPPLKTSQNQYDIGSDGLDSPQHNGEQNQARQWSCFTFTIVSVTLILLTKRKPLFSKTHSKSKHLMTKHMVQYSKSELFFELPMHIGIQNPNMSDHLVWVSKCSGQIGQYFCGFSLIFYIKLKYQFKYRGIRILNMLYISFNDL